MDEYIKKHVCRIAALRQGKVRANALLDRIADRVESYDGFCALTSRLGFECNTVEENITLAIQRLQSELSEYIYAIPHSLTQTSMRRKDTRFLCQLMGISTVDILVPPLHAASNKAIMLYTEHVAYRRSVLNPPVDTTHTDNHTVELPHEGPEASASRNVSATPDSSHAEMLTHVHGSCAYMVVDVPAPTQPSVPKQLFSIEEYMADAEELRKAPQIDSVAAAVKLNAFAEKYNITFGEALMVLKHEGTPELRVKLMSRVEMPQQTIKAMFDVKEFAEDMAELRQAWDFGAADMVDRFKRFGELYSLTSAEVRAIATHTESPELLKKLATMGGWG